MSGLVESYAKVRRGIVAFAPRYLGAGKTPFECVFGTGFVIGNSLIATNRHVAASFKHCPGYCATDPAVVALLFVPTPAGMAPTALNVTNAAIIQGVKHDGLYYGSTPPDVALVSVACTGLSEYAVMLNDHNVFEGQAIGTAGFPMGTDLLHIDGQLDHIAPTLQTGVVSAVLPFPSATENHCLMVNVMIQEGASGSPVFLQESGDVIGAIYARMYQPSLVDVLDDHGKAGTGKVVVNLPTNFAFVAPTKFIRMAIEKGGHALVKSVPSSSPTIGDIVASLPTEVTQKLTTGSYDHLSGKVTDERIRLSPEA